MTQKRKLELLAPAKNLECGRAAILHGADAIYVGGPKFGAREDAGNSIRDIEQLVTEARIFGVKIYAAFNTILYDNELDEAGQVIRQLYEAGVDALIVQDMGILEMDLPPIPLHASTQMHNYLPEQIQFLESVNFQRAVLARELSIEQIREIHRKSAIELEVFIHGALCVSLSGRCYLSHAIGGRSANRGACAQPCRRKYSLLDADKKVIAADRHLLSLRDLNQSESIRELAEAGVQSFKIEGRLKDVDYVKNVVAYYRQKIDAFLSDTTEYEAASDGKVLYGFEANPAKSFHRGATNYFLHGRTDQITSFESPKFLGEAVGFVRRVNSTFFEIESDIELANNDGLVFISKDGESVGIKVNTVEKSKIFPDKMNGVYSGAKVYRNYDHLFQQQLKKNLTLRKIEVTLELRATQDGFELSGRDERGNEVSNEFQSTKDLARDPQRSLETIDRQLSKTGDTPFTVSKIETNGNEKYFFQAAALNGLRRDLLNQLIGVRQNSDHLNVPFVANDYPYPQQHLSFEWNVSNRLARQFYRRHGVQTIEPAFEEQSNYTGKNVMTTKHCLKFQMGFCTRFGGQKSDQFKEPFYLADGNKVLLLEFDCAQCVMRVKY